MAYEIYKNVDVLHAVVFAEGALEAKNARESSHRRFLKGAWSQQIAKRTSNGTTITSKIDKNGFDERRLGVKRVNCLMQNG